MTRDTERELNEAARLASRTIASRGAKVAATGHELALSILTAALGEPRAWAIWNTWTAAQRDGAAEFVEEHFRAQLRSFADDLVAWHERVDV